MITHNLEHYPEVGERLKVKGSGNRIIIERPAGIQFVRYVLLSLAFEGFSHILIVGIFHAERDIVFAPGPGLIAVEVALEEPAAFGTLFYRNAVLVRPHLFRKKVIAHVLSV